MRGGMGHAESLQASFMLLGPGLIHQAGGQKCLLHLNYSSLLLLFSFIALFLYKS